jgi:predicted DNA-binding protein (MmcQ/YjbR family)
VKRIEINAKRIDRAQLISLGFCSAVDKEELEYISPIDSLKMTVKITFKNGVLFGSVYDEYKEEYTLHQTSSSGDFVDKVREEYKRIVSKIASSLEEKSEPFDDGQSARLVCYAREKYGTKLDFPFGDGSAIARHEKSGKWYFALLKITHDKLGIDSDTPCEVVNLKLAPSVIEKVVDNRKIFPAYHMNKKHWVSVLLNGTLDDSDLFSLVDMSYDLTKGK